MTIIDSTRLANVIFGSKMTEGAYKAICESIKSDMFTLSEHVVRYKAKDSVIGKVAYLLEDGTTILVSQELIESLNSLNIDKARLQPYMLGSVQKFKKIIETVHTHGSKKNSS